MAMFKAFKPSGMEKIARAMGYQGNMQGFQDYLAQDPMKQQQMQTYQQKAMQMARGGAVQRANVVRMQQGGLTFEKTGSPLGPLQGVMGNQNPMYKGVGVTTQTQQNAPPVGQPIPKGIYEQSPGFFPFKAFAAVEPPTGKKYAYTETGDRITVDKDFSDYATMPQNAPQQGVLKRVPGAVRQNTLEIPRGGANEEVNPNRPQPGSGYGQAVNLQTGEIAQPEYLKGTKEQYDAFRKQYMQGGPRAETADVRMHPMQGFDFRGSSTEFGAFQDYLRGQQQAMDPRGILPRTKPAANTGTVAPGVPLPAGGTYNDNPLAPRYLRDGIPPLPGMDDRGLGQPPQQPSQKVPQQYVPQQEFETVKKTQFKDPYGQAYDSKEEYEAAMLTAETRKFKTEDGQTIDIPFVGGRPTIQIPEGATATGDDPVKMYNEVYEIPQAEVGEIELAPTVGDITAQMLSKPGLPQGATTMAAQIQEQPGQMIDPTTGQVTGTVDVTATTAGTALATPAQEKEANLMQASTAAAGVDTALQATQAAQGTVDPKAEITAAQQTASSVGNVSAAQGNAILMDNPNQREIQSGELIDGVANAEKASKFTEEIQAAQATPSKQATVQGQLEGLMTQFEGGETPAWAAGAMRAATATMAARGLGASSLAGQAVVQAAMESALPIAQADAAVQSQFEAQNLSNRQQRAMLAAEQRAKFMGMEFDQAFQSRVLNAGRIADVANRNFTAEQQVALENSRIANSMNLANLNNSQALIMAEAAALSQLDMANLNNRQQAAVQNAQNFMQMDMANLSNRQQTEMFKSQQRIQSLFNDQAAENAARQFNASSQNQVDQFFANLSTQTSQFNASQTNAQNQFNAGQLNAIEQFNAEINNQRDQFNAKNQLVIAQNNAQWRREIATANTAAVNRANEINASAVLEMSRDAYDNLWNYYSDTMEWAWTSAESQLDRYQEMALEQLRQDKSLERTNIEQGTSAGNAIGNMIATLGSAIIPKLF